MSPLFLPLAELETQLILSKDLQYLPEVRLNPLLQQTNEVGRMIRGLQVAQEKGLASASP